MLEITESWYNQLIEDCLDITVETEFASNWALVEGRHLLGSRILQDYEKAQLLRMPDSELVQRIALSIKRSKRTVYYSIQFVRMFPDLNSLPDGKNVRWGHIVNKYLTDGKERVTIKKADLYRMIKEIKELLHHEWEENNQVVQNGKNNKETDILKQTQLLMEFEAAIVKCEFIRYLQDQVNKITEGIT